MRLVTSIALGEGCPAEGCVGDGWAAQLLLPLGIALAKHWTSHSKQMETVLGPQQPGVRLWV